MGKSTDAQIRASVKYNKNNVKQFKMNLNINTDKDIIDHLDKQPNKQGYVKWLIRTDMEKTT